MNREFSAGAIVFIRKNNRILFLLIYSRRNKIWGFPKGHIEQGEDEKKTALREIKEETGLGDLKIIYNFREEDVYETVSNRKPFKGQTIEKHSIYFLCKAKNKNIAVDNHEIADYRWVEIDETESLLKFGSTKQILKKASNFLKETFFKYQDNNRKRAV